MKFEEKKHLKKKEIAELLRGFALSMEKGGLKLGNSVVSMPEHLDVEVEYKEKEGRAKLEIEFKWSLEQASLALEKTDAKQVSIAEVKQGMKTAFNSLRETVEAGGSPASEAVAEFARLNGLFEGLATGAKYEKDLLGFSALVERFRDAVKAGRGDEVKSLVQEIGAVKKSCHKTYRWKED